MRFFIFKNQKGQAAIGGLVAAVIGGIVSYAAVDLAVTLNKSHGKMQKVAHLDGIMNEVDAALNNDSDMCNASAGGSIQIQPYGGNEFIVTQFDIGRQAISQSSQIDGWRIDDIRIKEFANAPNYAGVQNANLVITYSLLTSTGTTVTTTGAPKVKRFPLVVMKNNSTIRCFSQKGYTKVIHHRNELNAVAEEIRAELRKNAQISPPNLCAPLSGSHYINVGVAQGGVVPIKFETNRKDDSDNKIVLADPEVDDSVTRDEFLGWKITKLAIQDVSSYVYPAINVSEAQLRIDAERVSPGATHASDNVSYTFPIYVKTNATSISECYAKLPTNICVQMGGTINAVTGKCDSLAVIEPKPNVTCLPNPNPYSYGNVNTAGAFSDAIFTCTNNGGNESANFTGVFTLSGANQDQFTIQSDTCLGPLAAGAFCTVTVRFDPSTTGIKVASIDYTRSNPTTGLSEAQSINIRGDGVAPTPNLVCPIGLAYNFGSVVVGLPVTRDIVCTNTGGAAESSFSAPTITGTHASQFVFNSHTCSGTIAASVGTCTVRITFTPTSLGAKTANFNYNRSNGPASSVLTGGGTGPNVITLRTSPSCTGALAGTQNISSSPVNPTWPANVTLYAVIHDAGGTCISSGSTAVNWNACASPVSCVAGAATAKSYSSVSPMQITSIFPVTASLPGHTSGSATIQVNLAANRLCYAGGPGVACTGNGPIYSGTRPVNQCLDGFCISTYTYALMYNAVFIGNPSVSIVSNNLVTGATGGTTLFNSWRWRQTPLGAGSFVVGYGTLTMTVASLTMTPGPAHHIRVVAQASTSIPISIPIGLCQNFTGYLEDQWNNRLAYTGASANHSAPGSFAPKPYTNCGNCAACTASTPANLGGQAWYFTVRAGTGCVANTLGTASIVGSGVSGSIGIKCI